MAQIQSPQSSESQSMRARIALGFSDPISVEIPNESLSLPWREVVARALSRSRDPEAVRLRDVLSTRGEFQFENGGHYLAPDSSTASVLDRDPREERPEQQDEEPLVRLMRRQRGGRRGGLGG